MTPREGLRFLDALTDFGIKLGLDKIRRILLGLGNPQNAYPAILVAGTNGKGSVAKFLAEIFAAQGYKTGLYTSPHLVSVTERIQVNGRPVSPAVLDSLCLEMRAVIERMPVEFTPTYFEALTAAAFLHFAREKIDILVCEVGMGGRFDATNVLNADLSVVMPVSLDHTGYLGVSLEAIAKEKAGIIKEKGLLVCGRQPAPAKKVLKETVEWRGARSRWYPDDFRFRVRADSFPEGQTLDFYSTGRVLHGIRIGMLGVHQAHNCAVAIQAVLEASETILPVSETAIRKGAAAARWPARLQVLSGSLPLLLDGAHNEDGVRVLLRALENYFPGRRLPMLVGILKDKDCRKMLRLLAKKASGFFFVAPATPRALSAEELAAIAREEAPGVPRKTVVSVEEGLSALSAFGGKAGAGVVCGSLYLAGDVLRRRGAKERCGKVAGRSARGVRTR